MFLSRRVPIVWKNGYSSYDNNHRRPRASVSSARTRAGGGLNPQKGDLMDDWTKLLLSRDDTEESAAFDEIDECYEIEEEEICT